MPPKTKKGTPNPAARWMYQDDGGSFLKEQWAPYGPADSTAIEAAYAARQTTVAVSNGYSVDLHRMLQLKTTDRTRQRKVKRSLAAMPSTTPTPTSAASRSSKPAPTPPPHDRPVDLSAEAPDRKAHRPESASTADDTTPLLRHDSAKSTSTIIEEPKLAFTAATASNTAGPSDLAGVVRPTGGSFALIGCVSGSAAAGTVSRMPPETVTAVIRRVLAESPTINRCSLQVAADKMHPATRAWLQTIGRPLEQKGTSLSLTRPLEAAHLSTPVQLSSAAPSLSVGKLVELAGASRLSYFGPDITEPRVVSRSKLTEVQYREARRMMVSGPVKVLYDHNFEPCKSLSTVTVCSIPGINFAYSSTDQKDFTTVPEPGDPRVIDDAVALSHMTKVWKHVLTVMDDIYNVQFPVLCAIGCGAFKGKYGAKVPRLWAEALHTVLANTTFTHIHAVFLSAPTFGTDNNFKPFQVTLTRLHNETAPLKLPLVLVEDAPMLSIAAMIADWGYPSAVLNPSDVEAMRKGLLGMFWDGGHIALEEIIAMQTTLLLQHVGVCPELFTDPARRIAVDV